MPASVASTRKKKPMPETEKSTRQDHAAYAVTFTIALAIALGTLLPNEQLPDTQTSDKAIHLIAFALLTLPLSFAGAVDKVRLFMVSLCFGAAIELIQPYVGRSGEWLDFGADAAGAALGVLGGVVFSQVAKRLGRRSTAD
jgi:VanZ family protein